MGKVYVFFCSCFVILFTGCDPDESATLPPSSAYIKVFGGTGTERAADLVERSDGGFMVLGSSTSLAYSSGTSEDLLIIATDINGNEESSTYYDRVVEGSGTQTQESGVKLRKLEGESEGERERGYLAVGTSSFVTGSGDVNTDIFLVKIEPDGSYRADSVFVFPDSLLAYNSAGTKFTFNETAADVVEVSDGYVIVGTTDNVDKNKENPDKIADPLDVLVIKVSKNLRTVIWVKVTGFPGEDSGVAIERGSGDEVVIFGNTAGAAEGKVVQNNGNVFYARIASNGTPTSPTTFGRNNHERATAVVRNSSADFYVGGNSVSETGATQPFLLRVTGDDELSFNLVQTAEGDNIAGTEVNDLLRNDVGQLIFAGRIQSTDEAVKIKRSEAIMLRTSSAGVLDETFADDEVTRGRTFGANAEDFAMAVVQGTDGRLALLSTMDLNETNATTLITLIKTNSNGVLGK